MFFEMVGLLGVRVMISLRCRRGRERCISMDDTDFRTGDRELEQEQPVLMPERRFLFQSMY